MKSFKSPELILEQDIQAGSTSWSSPSNLAIIKYWGKHGVQLPRNPSISCTLSESYTTTSIAWSLKGNTKELIDLSFTFEGREQVSFSKRIKSFLESVLSEFPFLSQLKLEISSENTFPHSSGIASSASAMSALALCLCSMEQDFFETLSDLKLFFRKASYISRLGSGSAARSVYPYWAEWGNWEGNKDYSDLWASPLHEIDSSFLTMKDTILIASKKQKSVSSTAGHKLMEHNPYAQTRYKQANNRMRILEDALKNGDWDVFGKIAENEALTLHALMMNSDPSYILMEPATLLMIKEIRRFRTETNLPVYFSLDAGPNIHMLYPERISHQVDTLIQNQLLNLCENKEIIYDKVGNGPTQVK